MKLYVTVFLILVLTGCGNKPNEYFICEGYESENYSTNITSDFYGKESLVINQANKSLTFKFIDTDYKEPRPNYIFSQHKLTNESEQTHLLKFDIVTGELIWTVGKGEDKFGGLPIEKQFKYLCKKVEKLIK